MCRGAEGVVLETILPSFCSVRKMRITAIKNHFVPFLFYQ